MSLDAPLITPPRPDPRRPTPTYTRPSPLGPDTAQGQPQWYQVLDNTLERRQLGTTWILPELTDNKVTLRPELPFECAIGSMSNITRAAPRGPSNRADLTASHEHRIDDFLH